MPLSLLLRVARKEEVGPSDSRSGSWVQEAAFTLIAAMLVFCAPAARAETPKKDGASYQMEYGGGHYDAVLRLGGRAPLIPLTYRLSFLGWLEEAPYQELYGCYDPETRVLEGIWLQRAFRGGVLCSEPREARTHWGRFRFEFDPSGRSFDGYYAPCDLTAGSGDLAMGVFAPDLSGDENDPLVTLESFPRCDPGVS